MPSQTLKQARDSHRTRSLALSSRSHHLTTLSTKVRADRFPRHQPSSDKHNANARVCAEAGSGESSSSSSSSSDDDSAGVVKGEDDEDEETAKAFEPPRMGEREVPLVDLVVTKRPLQRYTSGEFEIIPRQAHRTVIALDDHAGGPRGPGEVARDEVEDEWELLGDEEVDGEEGGKKEGKARSWTQVVVGR
ncbi:hypothetical protein MNV49_005087 [Pseudohyphozyma bogoriensis]|nr:hypothetical protein MNV49_005087 [Pseudohyphozyma bogoriensis]